MSLRSFRFLVAALIAGALVVSLSKSASAQSISITNKASPYRYDTNNNLITPHPNLQQPLGVNLQDCREDQRIRFVLSMTNVLPGDVVEVWASDTGANCATDNVARTSSTAATCYKLGIDVPVLATTNVDIPVKGILHGLPANAVDADGCRRITAKTSINVQFLYFRGSNTGAAAASDNAPVVVKTQGPAGLTGVTLKPGNTHLLVSYDAIGEGGVEDIVRVNAYCDRTPTAAGATTTEVCDSSTGVDADAAGNATVTDGGCTSKTSPGKTIPPPEKLDSNGVACSNAAFAADGGGAVTPDVAFDGLYLCGTASGTTTTSITASRIENNTTVAVAIAAVDSFDNIGSLSSAQCQYGEKTTDFWDNYQDAGGIGTGGLCSITGPGMPAGTVTLFGLAVAVIVSAVRKKGRSAR